MKTKLGLELIGPCSDTGAEPNRYDTIATIDENGRVSFHKMSILMREGEGAFTVYTDDDDQFLSSECYLVYTTDAISGVKDNLRKLRDKFMR